jgi:hypothetical protein
LTIVELYRIITQVTLSLLVTFFRKEYVMSFLSKSRNGIDQNPFLYLKLFSLAWVVDALCWMGASFLLLYWAALAIATLIVLAILYFLILLIPIGKSKRLQAPQAAATQPAAAPVADPEPTPVASQTTSKPVYPRAVKA